MDVGEGHVGGDKTEWGGSHQNAFLYMYEIVQEWIYLLKKNIWPGSGGARL